MAEYTRVNGFGNYTTGTVRSVYQLKAFVIAVKDASSGAVDLRTLDDGAEEAVEAIIREVQPLMYYMPSDNSGLIHIVVDGHAVDATTLQTRVRRIAVGLGLGGTEAANDNDTTVTEASSFTVA